jgi:F0F1-type ATP synthase membrane subunit c/vacuolar-type H+-ATPase subunit K
LVLLLCEASRPSDRQRTRKFFQVALVVVAVLVSTTGFLGGAVVVGLNHDAWPQSSSEIRAGLGVGVGAFGAGTCIDRTDGGQWRLDRTGRVCWD